MASFSDPTTTKEKSAIWPPGDLEATWARLQPLITPELLVQLHLWGIPLVSQIPDPITKKHAVMTETMLQLQIERAVELAEAMTGLVIMPTRLTERLRYDRNEFQSFGYMNTARKPIWCVHKLTIQSSNGDDLHQIPNDWVEMGAAYRGQLQIIPLSLAFAQSSIVLPAGAGAGTLGASFLAATWAQGTVPAYWALEAEYGFKDGNVPALLNDLIGVIAAMEILGMLGATFARVNSQSIGLDGMSQSISTPGPNVFQVRIGELEKKRDRLISKSKIVFGSRFAFGTI